MTGLIVDPAAPSAAVDPERREEARAADAAPPPVTLTLFDPDAPTARATDPETSRDYGRGHPARNYQCARVLLVLAAQGGHGATCAEVVQALRTDRGNTARRVTDLSRLGLIYTSPRTRTVGGGRPQRIHFISEEGRRLVPVARELTGATS